MAVLAFVARLGVACRLASGFDAVVARHAALRCACVIEPVDRPLAGCVAAVTLCLRHDMVGRFAIGAHVIVASRAGLGRALEDCGLVARLAGDSLMGSRQRKPGRKMIEGGFARCRQGVSCDDRQSEHHSQECSEPSPDHANPDSLFPPGPGSRHLDGYRNPKTISSASAPLLGPRTETAYYREWLI